MIRLFQFFSIAMLTQVVLALSQLILLPIQIRTWGHSAIATWYSAVAVATLTTTFDLGLRTAGHLELLRYTRNRTDLLAGEQVQQVWGWIRILILILTLGLILVEAVSAILFQRSAYPPWKAALIIAFSLETLLSVRIVYLDSLGSYRGAEATYFAFAATRLAVSIPALLVWRWREPALALLFLATSALALVIQEQLCGKAGVLGMFAALPQCFSIRVLAVARYTLAEPFGNWVRLSLPVLVIASMAAPAAVTAYVALRAAFGAGRITIQQIARFASVEYIRLSSEARSAAAESFLSSFVLLAGVIGTVLGCFVVVDNLRLLGIWLARLDRNTFQIVALAFALTAPFFSYQVLLSLMFRTGQLAAVAYRQYAYVAYSSLFGALAYRFGSLYLYLVLLVISELLLSVTFLLPDFNRTLASRTMGGHRGVIAGFVGSTVALCLWLAARSNQGHIFLEFSRGNMEWTAMLLAAVLTAFVLLVFFSNRDLIRSAPRMFRGSGETRLVTGI